MPQALMLTSTLLRWRTRDYLNQCVRVYKKKLKASQVPFPSKYCLRKQD